MIVSPGLRTPALSASSTMRRAIRSLMLPPALKNSHLATKRGQTIETGACHRSTTMWLQTQANAARRQPRCRTRSFAPRTNEGAHLHSSGFGTSTKLIMDNG